MFEPDLPVLSGEMPDELDILPLLGMVIYPQVVIPLAVAQPASLRLLGQTNRDPCMLGMVALRNAQLRPDPVQPEDCYRVGTLVLVHRLLRLPDETLRVAVQGLQRFEIIEFLPGQEHVRARVRAVSEQPYALDAALMQRMQRLVDLADRLADSVPNFSEELLTRIRQEKDPGRLTYLVAAAALLRRSVAERQELLESSDVVLRSTRLEAMLVEDLHLLQREGPALGKAVQVENQADATENLPSVPPAGRLERYASQPGSVLWLSWTPAGAECGMIEAVQMAGAKQFWLTGPQDSRLHDAAHVALSWVRAESAQLGLSPRFFDELDLHVHIPVDVAPEDMTAAGVAIALALVSLLTSQPFRADVALTGELTLHGRVLPVTRISEKIRVAYQAGIRQFVLPAANAPDLALLPAHILDDIVCVYAENMDRVMEVLSAERKT